MNVKGADTYKYSRVPISPSQANTQVPYLELIIGVLDGCVSDLGIWRIALPAGRQNITQVATTQGNGCLMYLLY